MKLDTLFSGLITAAAVAIAGSVAFRTMVPARDISPAVAGKSEFVSNWRDAIPLGIRVGDSAAPITIVEFADLECPACRSFQSTIHDILGDYKETVSLVYVHFPLPQHRFALPAARGLECAASAGRGPQWIDAVFEKQDSLGLRSWGGFARDAGLSDTAALTKCVMDPSPFERIEGGRALGVKIRVQGTPTVLINGLRFPNTPTRDEMAHVIDSLVRTAKRSDAP